ncbi:YcxB family protein [Vagococcus intermedius]|uniref:YcxB family protein n=1 Tax=Vagococcus intermedius TaxID=2991418 RepID=UPI0034637472
MLLIYLSKRTFKNDFSLKELKDLFILYYSASNAIVIPKRTFNSKEDILIFKTLFLNNMNNGKSISKITYKKRHSFGTDPKKLE